MKIKNIRLILFSAIFVVSRNLEDLLALRIGNLGDFMALTATLLFAVTVILAKKYLSNLDSGVITFYRFLFGSIPLILYLIYINSLYIDSIYQILAGIAIGVGGIFYYEGLKRLKAVQAGFVELTSPLYAAIFAFFLFNEAITVLQFIGVILLFFGIYFLSKEDH